MNEARNCGTTQLGHSLPTQKLLGMRGKIYVRDADKGRLAVCGKITKSHVRNYPDIWGWSLGTVGFEKGKEPEGYNAMDSTIQSSYFLHGN